MAEVSSSATGSVSSCKDQVSFVSLGLGCLYLLVLLPNKQHLHRAEQPSWVQRAPWGCGGGCCWRDGPLVLFGVNMGHHEQELSRVRGCTNCFSRGVL